MIGAVLVKPCTYQPELNEVLQVRGSYKKAVEQRIRQEQHEALVVGESHAVVDPATRREGNAVVSARFNLYYRRWDYFEHLSTSWECDGVFVYRKLTIFQPVLGWKTRKCSSNVCLAFCKKTLNQQVGSM